MYFYLQGYDIYTTDWSTKIWHLNLRNENKDLRKGSEWYPWT